MQPAAGHANDRVSCARSTRVNELVALDETDAKAREIKRVVGEQPGCSAVSPPTSAQPMAAQASPTPPTRSRDGLRVELADSDVVQEVSGLGAMTDDVVGTHRDKVLTDRPKAAHAPCDLRFRAYAVRRSDDDGSAHTLGDLDQRAELAREVSGLRKTLAKQLNGHLAGRDVDARFACRPYATSAGDHELVVLEQELVIGHVIRHRHGVVAIEAGEAEALAGQIERVENAADRQIRRASRRPTNARISSSDFVEAISSVSICVSMP